MTCAQLTLVSRGKFGLYSWVNNSQYSHTQKHAYTHSHTHTRSHIHTLTARYTIAFDNQITWLSTRTVAISHGMWHMQIFRGDSLALITCRQGSHNTPPYSCPSAPPVVSPVDMWTSQRALCQNWQYPDECEYRITYNEYWVLSAEYCTVNTE